ATGSRKGHIGRKKCGRKEERSACEYDMESRRVSRYLRVRRRDGIKCTKLSDENRPVPIPMSQEVKAMSVSPPESNSVPLRSKSRRSRDCRALSAYFSATHLRMHKPAPHGTVPPSYWLDQRSCSKDPIPISGQ